MSFGKALFDGFNNDRDAENTSKSDFRPSVFILP